MYKFFFELCQRRTVCLDEDMFGLSKYAVIKEVANIAARNALTEPTIVCTVLDASDDPDAVPAEKNCYYRINGGAWQQFVNNPQIYTS